MTLPKTTWAVPPVEVTSAVISTSPGFWQRHQRFIGPGALGPVCESCVTRAASLAVTGHVAIFELLQGWASGPGPGTIFRATLNTSCQSPWKRSHSRGRSRRLALRCRNRRSAPQRPSGTGCICSAACRTPRSDLGVHSPLSPPLMRLTARPRNRYEWEFAGHRLG